MKSAPQNRFSGFQKGLADVQKRKLGPQKRFSELQRREWEEEVDGAARVNGGW
jgi:hypothetical protein